MKRWLSSLLMSYSLEKNECLKAQLQDNEYDLNIGLQLQSFLLVAEIN